MFNLRLDDEVEVKQLLGTYIVDSEIAQKLGQKGRIIKIQHPAYRVLFSDGTAFTFFREEIEKCYGGV